MAEQNKTDRADAQIKKMEREADGRRAMTEYLEEQAAVRARTERLRQMRLAHEAKVAAVERAAPAKPAAAKKPTAAKKPAAAKKRPVKKTADAA